MTDFLINILIVFVSLFLKNGFKSKSVISERRASMPTEQQIIAILKKYGASKKSIQISDMIDGVASDNSSYFIKLNKRQMGVANRDTQRFPHISPSIGDTPVHMTSIRFIKCATSDEKEYDIIQRYHQHVKNDGTLSEDKRHDRFRAVDRKTGAVHVAAVAGLGPNAGDVKTLDQLRALTYNVGIQKNERQQPMFLSKSVMNRFNIGEM